MAKGGHETINNTLRGHRASLLWNRNSFSVESLDDAADAILMNDKGNKAVAKEARKTYWKKKQGMRR